jgi:molybdopterin-guanine dinucleotide biosynthesis protein A
VYDAVVLAGGRARRLGGVDKPGLDVGGSSLLDRVLTATAGAGRTVVVGPARSTSRAVLWTHEQPPGGGPVAGLAAGLEQVEAPVVLLLAADLPFLDPAAVALLTRPFPDGMAGRMLVDGEQAQWLCGAWSTAALRAALRGVSAEGARLRDVLGPLPSERLTWTPSDPARPAPWTDVDTDDDLRRARELA